MPKAPPFPAHLLSRIIAAALIALAPACSAVHSPKSTTPAVITGPSTLTIIADWNDIDAASRFAVVSIHAVVTSSIDESNLRQRITLRQFDGESGSLLAERTNPGISESTSIQLTANLGRFGDPPDERKFLIALANRLEQLRGVDFAPLPDN